MMHAVPSMSHTIQARTRARQTRCLPSDCNSALARFADVPELPDQVCQLTVHSGIIVHTRLLVMDSHHVAGGMPA
ncbi:MAG: hypothetical protein H7838_10250 [Magnetococcus sp. DMHC-8]